MSEITPNTPNPVREDAYKNELATKLGIEPQYIPKSPVWRNEEEIAALAEMFANMAGGGSSGGGVLVVGVTETELPNGNIRLTLNKTWQEIHDADYPVIKQSGEDGSSYMTVLVTSGFNADYVISAYTVEATLQFSCASASGYPSTEIEP